jgi:hypothetical protein
MKIDALQVPREKLTDPRFLQLQSHLEAALRNQGWVTAFCAHEVAHIVYLTRAGMKDFTFIGATILYDAARDDFDGFPASVKPGGFNNDVLAQINVEQWILAVAMGHAAGGVAARKLTTAPDSGDQGDYQNFCTLCDVLCARHPDLTIDRPGLWKLAQGAVEKELRSPTFRKEIWDKAHEIKPLLFGST